MKTSVISKGNYAAPLLSAENRQRFTRIFMFACAAALVVSLCATHLIAQNELRKSCESVAAGFTSIMRSYRHSFQLFEKLLQQEILNADSVDEIEAFLKEQDGQLLDIEGGDYDGVYMYYQGRYLYSWDTPYAVYHDSGYDATRRPWYTGAVAARGEIFFSVPYPSYANDYMLATISRLQPDGETVIAYDIKLGEICKYVDKLDIYNGALTLICDADGNIIGSTNRLYQGGNFMMSADMLEQNVLFARRELETAVGDAAITKAEQKVHSAEAQQKFVTRERDCIVRMMNRPCELQYDLWDVSFSFAYDNGVYTCFVHAPVIKLLPQAVTLWAALSFLFIIVGLLLRRMASKNSQILTDVLTGLNNRRAFHRYYLNHIQHHPEDDIYLIMLDLNDFKKINDKCGHIAGDKALQDTATVLKRICARASCNFFLCRFGGDEFLLAGANCDAQEVAASISLISTSLSDLSQTQKTPYTLSASIGVSHGKCCDATDLDRLLAAADTAMYKDKMRRRGTDGG